MYNSRYFDFDKKDSHSVFIHKHCLILLIPFWFSVVLVMREAAQNMLHDLISYSAHLTRTSVSKQLKIFFVPTVIDCN